MVLLPVPDDFDRCTHWFANIDPPASVLKDPLLRLPASGDNAAMQTEPSKAEPPKRKRRWLQFSLRTLMIVVTLLAVPCAYVGWQTRIVIDRKAVLSSRVTASFIPHTRTTIKPSAPMLASTHAEGSGSGCPV